MRGLRWSVCGLLGLALLCGGCSSGPAAPFHVRLDAGPVTAPFDTPVRITLTGLPLSGLVTLDARATDYLGRAWVSSAEYRSTGAGTLNLSTAVPVAGSYHVADAAGLLWSLHPAFTSNPAAQYFMNSTTGFSLTVRVLAEGHVQGAVLTELIDDLTVICEKLVTVREPAPGNGLIGLPRRTR